MNITWTKIKSNCLKNLHVAFNEVDVPMGMIEKPADTKHSKNFWRMYVGVGAEAKFIGHAVNKKEAMNHIHWALVMSTASDWPTTKVTL